MTLLPSQPPLTITRQATLGPVDQLLLLLLLIQVLRRLGILPSPPPDLATVDAVLAAVNRVNPSRWAEAKYWADSLANGQNACVMIA